MIYALCDPRENRQEIYIGTTVDHKARLTTHIRDGKNDIFSRTKLDGLKTSYKSNWIKKILDEGLKPQLIIIDEFETFSESDWIRKFAEENFVLQNSRIDITNCLDGYGLKGEGTKIIPNIIYQNAIENIQRHDLYKNINRKILISEYTKTTYINGDLSEYSFFYYSYPTKIISLSEENKFQKEYFSLQQKYEVVQYPSIISFDNLYLMDTEGKKAFVRDYFDNDLLGFVLEHILSTESDEEDNWLIEDIKLLLNNNFEISPKHKDIILNTKNDWLNEEYNFLLDYCADRNKKPKIKCK